MTKQPAQPKPAPSIRRLADLWTVLGRDRPLYAAAIVVQGLVAALQYVVPLVPQSVMDVVFGQSPRGAPPLSRKVTELLGGVDFLHAHLWVAGVVIAAAALCAAVLSVVRGRMTARASQASARRLRERVHSHLIRLPVPYFDKTESGDLLQRCTSDVDTVQNLLSNQIAEMGRSILLVLLAVPLMLAIDVSMAMVSLALVIPIVTFAVLYFRVVSRRFRHKDEAEGRLTARAQENITGIRVVRAFGRQRFEREEFRKRNQEHRDADIALFDAFSRFWSLSDVTCLAQMLLVLVAGLWRVAHGTLGAGEYFFFLFATNMYIWPIRMLGRMLADLGKALVALERLHEVLDTKVEEARPGEPMATERLPAGAVEFHDVSFSYLGGAQVLDKVSFTVGPNETVALMGPSGSGKSTIASLLQRFYEPTSGRITKGGTPLDTLDRRLIRARTASVLQPPFIYSRSVRDNVRLARADLTHEGVVSAAEDAAIHSSVERFQKGYDTVIGERGITLSGGQRQRLAIARALVRDADLMILDDALSAVDGETEQRILDAMRNRKGLPTVVIAHRLSTLAEADRIVVLERGRVTDQGTHEELIARPGLYRRLWDIQAELEAEEPAP
ncbi:MAG: ABC transporter ATP-binding protein/permease [Planctomycetes bacterium]|nr:ABC transporter ATP-binding protein/permease [Planctomycetota bacterium]